MVQENPERIIFVGQKPRYANQNLGYIEFGNQTTQIGDIPVYEFTGFQYRPHLSTAEEWVKDGHHAWNLGYFVTTPRFLWKLFKQFAPQLFAQLEEIYNAIDTPNYEEVLHRVYPLIEKISFDNAVLEKMDHKYGYVLSIDLGWSDIGAWEALKEALAAQTSDNVTKGNVLIEDSTDTLMFNFTDHQLVVGIDLKELIIVNTKDVILICPKTSIPKVKKLVENLGDSHKHLA